MEKIDYGKKVLVRNSLLSIISRGVSMIISFITAPLLLGLLGTDKYGVWATLLSLVSWIYTFDLGIANGLRNKLAECLALNKDSEARKYIGISYLLLSMASLFMLIFSIFLTYSIDIDSVLNIHLQDEDIRCVLVVAIFFACVNFTASLIRQTFYALQQSGLDAVVNTIAQALFAIALFVLSKFQMGYLMLVAVFEGFVQFSKNFFSSCYVFTRYQNLRFGLSDIDRRYAGGILSFGIQMFIVQIAALVLNATDNIIISHYFGSEEVTPYSICYKYFGMIESVYVAVFTPLMGAYTAAYARRDMPFINKLIRKNFLGYILFLIMIVIAWFIFKPFTALWLGKELIYADGLVPLVALYFAMLMCTHVFSCILTAFSMVKEVTIAVILEAVVNIPISVYCAVYLDMGVTGVIMGSLAAMLIAIIAFPTKAILVLRKLNKDYSIKGG